MKYIFLLILPIVIKASNPFNLPEWEPELHHNDELGKPKIGNFLFNTPAFKSNNRVNNKDNMEFDNVKMNILNRDGANDPKKFNDFESIDVNKNQRAVDDISMLLNGIQFTSVSPSLPLPPSPLLPNTLNAQTPIASPTLPQQQQPINPNLIPSPTLPYIPSPTLPNNFPIPTIPGNPVITPTLPIPPNWPHMISSSLIGNLPVPTGGLTLPTVSTPVTPIPPISPISPSSSASSTIPVDLKLPTSNTAPTSTQDTSIQASTTSSFEISTVSSSEAIPSSSSTMDINTCLSYQKQCRDDTCSNKGGVSSVSCNSGGECICNDDKKENGSSTLANTPDDSDELSQLSSANCNAPIIRILSAIMVVMLV